MRFVFMDEAGTSGAPHENARVVVGVIVHADTELRAAEAALDEALQDVPTEFRDGFVFHAEDIMNNQKYRDRWRLTGRVNLLKNVMAIPSRLNLPISLGQTWKSSPAVIEGANFTPEEDQHWIAFSKCVGVADAWIRSSAGHNEIATIVAKDCSFAKHLTSIPSILRAHPFVTPNGPNMIVGRSIDKTQGFNSQEGITKVTRIRKTIHWVNKQDDNLVWIADACAYGLKRFFNESEFGQDFCTAILGGRHTLDIELYKRSVSSSQVLWNRPQPRWARPDVTYSWHL